jgi:hypothetical protein
MTVGEYGRIAKVAFIAAMGIAFLYFAILLVSNAVVEGHLGAEGYVASVIILLLLVWVIYLCIRDVWFADASFSSDLTLPAILAGVSGLLLGLNVYNMLHRTWSGTRAHCDSWGCFSYEEGHLAGDIAVVSLTGVLIVAVMASAWWLFVSWRDLREPA